MSEKFRCYKCGFIGDDDDLKDHPCMAGDNLLREIIDELRAIRVKLDEGPVWTGIPALERERKRRPHSPAIIYGIPPGDLSVMPRQDDQDV